MKTPIIAAIKRTLLAKLFLCMSLLIVTNFVVAQINVVATGISKCNRSDGKATITIANSAPELDLEYAVDGKYQNTNSFDSLSAGDHVATARDKNTKCEFSKSFTINNAPDQMSLSISGFGTTEFCTNTSPIITLIASASGGSGKYRYNWGEDASITVSSSGRYSATVVDTVTGCSESSGGDVIFVPIICSRDPNDIVGPEGFGPDRMISKMQSHGYMIRFENDPDFATAPAQVVRINHPLDSNVNPLSLRLGDFGFANRTFHVPSDKTFYTIRLDLVDSLGVVVDVTAGIDITKKEAFWLIESKDPQTGLPPVNATLGFLPINDSTGKGEGFVTYRIRAANHTRTRDLIHAKASIVFDVNAPIETPVLFNMIDALPPISKIKALPEKSSSKQIDIMWEGKDDLNGSGVREYDLYVSQGGAPFTVYESAIKGNSTAFTGEFGQTYRFFTLATDSVGNQEILKTDAEATVYFSNGSLPVTWLLFRGEKSGNDIILEWTTATEINSKFFAVERSVDGLNFKTIGTIKSAGSSNSITAYSYKDVNAVLLNSMQIYYRLRQVDIDDKYSYSPVLFFEVSKDELVPAVKAYPNPFSTNISLQLLNVSTVTDINDAVQLFTLEGRMIYQRQLKNRSGSTVLLNDLPSIRPGIYLLKTTLNRKSYIIKMYKK